MDAYHLLTSLFMLLCSFTGVTLSLLFIGTVIVDRRCRTVITFITLNTIVAGLMNNTIFTSQAIYQMITDTVDILCPFRGFLLHSSTGLLYHTLCVQTLYRLFVTVYAHKRHFQSPLTIALIVIVQWSISIAFGIPILALERINYQADGRICQVSVDDIFSFLYLGTFIYLAPLPLIMLIYVVIVNYMKRDVVVAGVRQRAIERNRQQREHRFVQRILVIVFILFLTGFPYLVFFLLVNIGHVPLPFYGHRMSYMFLSFGQGVVMVLNLMYSDDVRSSFLSMLERRFGWGRRGRVENIPTIAVAVQGCATASGRF